MREMESLERFAAEKLAAVDALERRRRVVPTRRLEGQWLERDGCQLLSFSCNDYLGLADHPAVKAAAAEAALTHGAGARASRLVTGDHPPLRALEAELAAFKGTEAACLFGSGYLSNVGIITALMSEGDLIVMDSLAHACLWTGARLSSARLVLFHHNDMDHLRDILEAERERHRHALVVTEGVFSMDGDRARLGEIAALCDLHDAWPLVDDAHGFGVIGPGGRGAVAEAGLSLRQAPLQMGTLSKALGSYGGYLCASAQVIEMIRNRARSFIYTTAPAPAVAGAALAALRLLRDDPGLAARPLALARLFCRRTGLPEAQSAVVPLVLGPERAALEAAAALERAGFLVVAIRPPTVPEGTARLRFSFSAAHAEADVERLAEAVVAVRETLR